MAPAQVGAAVMPEEYPLPNFLGLSPRDASPDVQILSLPYELTTSYGQGTDAGPAACIAASTQVELYDPLLEQDLPAGFEIQTAAAWVAEGPTLAAQLDAIEIYLTPYFDGSCFPLTLGGEHGLLPPLLRALKSHPAVKGELGQVSLVQIDAHSDLRDELDGEQWSHACVARRALDLGLSRVLQVGVRQTSREETLFAASDSRVDVWYARDLFSPCGGSREWDGWIKALTELRGVVHLTLDVDGLDGSLVPATGTPVPGGLAFWQAIETIETLFANPDVYVTSADVCEIVPDPHSNLTEFTAALLATKIVAAHLAARQAGRWNRY